MFWKIFNKQNSHKPNEIEFDRYSQKKIIENVQEIKREMIILLSAIDVLESIPNLSNNQRTEVIEIIHSTAWRIDEIIGLMNTPIANHLEQS